MLTWLSKRRRTAEDLARTLKESQELLHGALAVCETQTQINQQLAAQLAETRTENARLWAALGAPAPVQQFIAAGFSEAEAERLKDAPHA